MTVSQSSVLDLLIEKAVAGGRMLGRHDGQVVLVWGAIPGERVKARVDRVARGVVYATAVDVVTASPDRRGVSGDWRCGGNVYAHIAYPRQQQLKGEVIADALARIGRITAPVAPPVVGSPELGYRMRARLHVRDSRAGFFREESHELCDAGATGQLLPDTTAWIERLEAHLRSAPIAGVTGVEIAENVPATERVCHLELREDVPATSIARLADAGGLTGLIASTVTGGVTRHGSPAWGLPTVTDVLQVSPDARQMALRLRRDVRAFFQGNRFLLEPLVRHVLSLVPAGPVVDLYAGVGLFGLSVAARGGDAADSVTVVEGDPVSGADLRGNAEPFAGRVEVRRMPVEAYLRAADARGGARPAGDATVIVDPPRTGMSPETLAGIVAWRPARIVFVSCDPATLARDLRAFTKAGYAIDGLTGFDLFPNTAHVEAVALLTRARL